MCPFLSFLFLEGGNVGDLNCLFNDSIIYIYTQNKSYMWYRFSNGGDVVFRTVSIAGIKRLAMEKAGNRHKESGNSNFVGQLPLQRTRS